MTIGELAKRTGLSVRTLRFYADEGVLPEVERTESGYRLFDPEAVGRGRLVRTLRELGMGLVDIKRVLAAEAPLAEIAAAHALALDAQIRTLRLQRAILRTVARSTDPRELGRMSELITLTVEERRRILEDYLNAVFSGEPSPVADRLRQGAPELPEDPTPEQIAAWIELAELLRDPGYIEISRRMALRAREEGPVPDGGQKAVAAIAEHAGAAARARIDPGSDEALEVIERIESLTPDGNGDRAQLAERIEAFTDARVSRYWALVAIINGWRRDPAAADGTAGAWTWYLTALRAHP